MFPKVAKIISTAVLHLLIFFKIAQKSPIFMGYFCRQICCTERSKIAQSGHTGYNAVQNKKYKDEVTHLFNISGELSVSFLLICFVGRSDWLLQFFNSIWKDFPSPPSLWRSTQPWVTWGQSPAPTTWPRTFKKKFPDDLTDCLDPFLEQKFKRLLLHKKLIWKQSVDISCVTWFKNIPKKS